MRARKIVLVGAALAAVSFVTMGAVSIVSHDRGSVAQAVATNAGPDRDVQRVASTAPITPADAISDRGWGPFRTTDW